MVDFNAQTIKGKMTLADNSYNEDEILMPKSAIRGVVPAIIGIEIEFKENVLALPTDADESRWHLSIKSEDAIQNISESGVLTAGGHYLNLTTDIGIGAHPCVERVNFPAPIPITADKLFLGAVSDLASAQEIHYQIHWVPRYIKGISQQQQVANYAQF